MLQRNVGSTLLSLVAVLAVAGFAIGFASNASVASEAERSAEEKGPKEIAAYFHADWCGYCKQLGPRFDDLQNKFDAEPVLYVKFDMTTETNRRQSRYLAYALGLDSLWEEHGGSTGFVAYIDASKRQKLAKADHTQGLCPIGDELKKCVAHTKGERR